MSAQGTKKTVYEIVTEQILAALVKGTVPWRKPWASGFHDPVNITGRRYRGINRVLLGLADYACPVWATWNQIQERGGHVKRGEHAQLVVYWLERNRDDGSRGDHRGIPGEEPSDGERAGRSRGIIPLYYRVFNAEQTDGLALPEKYQTTRPAPTRSAIETMDLADGVVRTMPNPPAIGMGGGRAYYRPSTDHIQMPPREAFEGAAGYATTLFHEATHATGHSSRLSRILPESLAPFGSEDYSREELVAEIGACFLMRRTGIGSDLTNSAAYIAGWLRALQENSTWVIGAATQAQRASDYILGPEESEKETEKEHENETPTDSNEPPVLPEGDGRSAAAQVPPGPSNVPVAVSAAVHAPSIDEGANGIQGPAEKAHQDAVAPSVVPRTVEPSAAGPFSVTVDRKAFAEAFGRVRKAIDRKSTMPVLSHVLLVAGPKGLTLVGTDLEWMRREAIPAAVEGMGSLTLPAAPLQTLVTKLKSAAELTLTEEEGGWIGLQAGSTRYRIAGGPASDYPAPLAVSERVRTSTGPAAALARALSRVQHAVCADPTRQHLCGVHVDSHAEGVRVVATDGHRLAIDRVDGPVFPAPLPRDGITLPRAVIPHLVTLLRAAAQVEIRLDTDRAEFSVGDGALVTRLVEGDLPEYERVIPKGRGRHARLRVADLAGAIDRVRVVAKDRDHGIRVALTAGELSVACNDPDLGEAIERIPAEYEGPDSAIGFNAGYLLDVLDVAKGSAEIELFLRDELSQGAFRIVGDADFLAVVMPMRI